MQDIIPRSADSLFKKHVPRSFSTIERFPKVQFLFQPLPVQKFHGTQQFTGNRGMQKGDRTRSEYEEKRESRNRREESGQEERPLPLPPPTVGSLVRAKFIRSPGRKPLSFNLCAAQGI